jgi:hypothetical protein
MAKEQSPLSRRPVGGAHRTKRCGFGGPGRSRWPACAERPDCVQCRERSVSAEGIGRAEISRRGDRLGGQAFVVSSIIATGAEIMRRN